MESDQSLPVKEVGGINLDNYFPYQSSFNTVLYVHKRFSERTQKEVGKGVTEKKRKEDKKKLSKVEKIAKCDTKSCINKKEKSENVLQQTIRFAKNLVPIVIPPSENGDTPVYYTIKTCTKCQDTGHIEKCDKIEEMAFEKKKSKKSVATYKKDKKTQKESFSESITSQSNTLDDINNQSLSCTLSELSDKRDKYQKNTENNKKKKRDSNKLRISESLEGLATEVNNVGETSIKIHLMNDREKLQLTESIRKPVVDAVSNRIKDLDNAKMKEEVKTVQRLVMNNSQKLDCILERLACIENYLMNANFRVVRSPKPKVHMPSKLEQLSEDLIDEKEYSSEEEMPKLDSNRQSDRLGDDITILHPVRRERIEDIGCGELPGSRPSTSVGVKTERPRQPARFCWTDTERNN